MNPYIRMREIKNIEEVHHIILGIAKEFHRICVKNNIPYYLAYGSMLGAVRHRGFIPWDDDLDVYVPRKYFGQLRKFIERDLSSHYVLRDNKDIPQLWGEILKLEDNRTVVVEGNFEHGVFMDIFPLDYNDNSKSFFSRNQTVRRLLKLDHVSKRQSKSMKTIVAKLFCSFLGRTIFVKLIKFFVKKKGSYLTSYSGYYMNELFESSVIGTPVLYPFCDTQLYGVEHPEAYLTTLYGDYMQLPPVEQRRVHLSHAFYKD